MRTFFQRLLRGAALLSLVTLAGCFTRASRGENGVVELAYDEGALGCLFGCDAREPMAARANTVLDVLNADEIPPFDVSSSDESVLEFIQNGGRGDSSIRVVSHDAGSAHIVFTDAAGEEIDRYELEVRDVDRIELRSPDIRDRYLIMVGGTDGLGIDLFDNRDRDLKGYGGVDYALTGSIGETELTLVSALADAIAAAFVGSTSESASVEALAVGDGQIEITAPSGASLTIPVEVVDETAVDRVEVEDATEEPSMSEVVSASAFHADGEQIHEPECTWSIEPAGGPVTITSENRDSVTVTSDVSGSATVTCTVGSASGSGTVTFAPAM